MLVLVYEKRYGSKYIIMRNILRKGGKN